MIIIDVSVITQVCKFIPKYKCLKAELKYAKRLKSPLNSNGLVLETQIRFYAPLQC